MIRRSARALWPLALLVCLLGWRAAGCRKSGPGAAPAHPKVATPIARHWITPLLTAPPPLPTPTLWKGVTRVPILPE